MSVEDMRRTSDADGGAPTGTSIDHAAADPVRLATAAVAIARLTVSGLDLRQLLAGIARASANALGDGVWVSVNLGHPAAPTQLASSDERAAVADGLQVRTGEGPCVDAFEARAAVAVDDVVAHGRWPRLCATWGESPAAAVLAVPLLVGGDQVGCLNCYSAAPGRLTAAHARAVDVLALAAGAALEATAEMTRLREHAEHLDRAMASRAVIDQAKGIVIARHGGTADEAFARLTALSQQRNVKVRDLARTLVEQTGTASPVGRRPS